MSPSRAEGCGGSFTLGAVLLLALVLRVWNIAHGLPAVYSLDEARHFVRYAVQFLETGSLQLDYFVNPPALTYLFAGAFGAVFGGGPGAARAFAENVGSVYLVARIVGRRARRCLGVAPLLRGQSPLRPPHRPAVGGDCGGCLLVDSLRPLRGQ